jgi:hypothetical protein
MLEFTSAGIASRVNHEVHQHLLQLARTALILATPGSRYLQIHVFPDEPAKQIRDHRRQY